MQALLLHKLKYILPALVCFSLVLLSIVPFSFIPFYQTQLPIVLIVIFCFAVFNPDSLNGICVFFIGLFADLIMGSPFGLQAFAFVLLFFLANINRRFLLALTFPYLWAMFALFLIIIYFVWYLLFSLISFRFLSLDPFVFQYIVLVLIYPAISWFCGWLNIKIGAKE